jgi:hypothetical protein
MSLFSPPLTGERQAPIGQLTPEEEIGSEDVAVVTVVRVVAPRLIANPPHSGNTMSEARRSREGIRCRSHWCHWTPTD